MARVNRFVSLPVFMPFSLENGLQCFDTVGWVAGRASAL